MDLDDARKLAQGIIGNYAAAKPVIADFRAGRIPASEFADQMDETLKVNSDTAATIVLCLNEPKGE
jgi:hypothetical protein